jgi:hypothetical protein
VSTSDHVQEELKIPRPIPGGTYSEQSLGRWIDRLMGAERHRRAADRALEPLFAAEETKLPEPVEVPEPLPGGTDG